MYDLEIKKAAALTRRNRYTAWYDLWYVHTEYLLFAFRAVAVQSDGSLAFIIQEQHLGWICNDHSVLS